MYWAVLLIGFGTAALSFYFAVRLLKLAVVFGGVAWIGIRKIRARRQRQRAFFNKRNGGGSRQLATRTDCRSRSAGWRRLDCLDSYAH